MTRSVILDARQRQALLDRYRKDPDPEVRFRAHILLLLADGHTWATVATFLFCSSRTIDRWVQAFPRGGSRGGARPQPRPAFSLRCRMAGRRRRLGQYQGPARLRLPPQPMVLRGRRPLDAATLSSGRQLRGDPPMVASRRNGLPSAAPRPEAGRGGTSGQAGRVAAALGRVAR